MKDHEIVMVAAAGENNELGRDGDLIWHLPDDFKRFKRLTTGHPIIMGRKTFESFPKPLPNRTHIVITTKKDYTVEGHIVVHSIDDAVQAARQISPLIFIIGGGEIYKLYLPMADRIELTRVHGKFDADTYFPKLDESVWEVKERIYHDTDERHDYAFEYLTLIRKQPKNE